MWLSLAYSDVVLIRIKEYGSSKVICELRQLKLEGADLQKRNLQKADFSRRDVSDVDFRGADLSGAVFDTVEGRRTSFAGAKMVSARFSGCQFGAVDFEGGRLEGSKWHETSAYNTNFSACDFRRSDLNGVHAEVCLFHGATFEDASFARLSFVQCLGLHETIGLVSVFHRAPSAFDNATLRDSCAGLPEAFLLNAGFSIEEVQTLQGMYRSGIRFYSCFISYTEVDKDLAFRLHTDLIANGVSCWQDEHNLKGGDFWRRQINEALRIYDKVLVICSEASLQRPEVVEEILQEIEQERVTNSKKLFPIRVDEYIFTESAVEAVKKLPPRQQREDWLSYLRNYHVPDFSGWRDYTSYMECLNKLLRDLKATDSISDRGGESRNATFKTLHEMLGFKYKPEELEERKRIPRRPGKSLPRRRQTTSGST